jgi:hypothetical protein
MTATIGDRVWQVPRDQFVAAWGAAATLDEAAVAVRVLAGGPAPRWALIARAAELRADGVALKPLPTGTPPSAA